MSTCLCGNCHSGEFESGQAETGIHSHAAPGEGHTCAHGAQDGCQDAAAPDEKLLAQASPGRAIYRIMNMDCPMEEALIRKKLGTVPGITGLSFNLMQRVLTVDHEPGRRPAIEEALKAIDMVPEALGAATIEAPPESQVPWKKLAWSGFFAALSEAAELCADWHIAPFGLEAVKLAGWPLAEILPLLLAIVAITLAGLDTFRKGWLAISNFNLNINALMAVAVTGAVLIGQFPEAAMVMVLFNISEAIEARALDHARKAIKDLLDMAPAAATVLQADGTWREMPVDEVSVGRVVRVRPGQKIALDGEITNGESTVNQAPITGESMPVEKKAGDPVYAGTINETGSFEFRVTAAANDTTLARIIHAVEEAQGSRAPTQRFVDVFARYYTPAVFLLAILWAFVPPLAFGAPWYGSIYTALVILVIGCPCALVISTPITVVCGLAAATRRGILVKGGLYLEQGRRLNWLALDKTGTITHGEPRLTDTTTLGAMTEARALHLAASLAARSDHPVSRAIARAAGDIPLEEVAGFAALPGKGVSGLIGGEKWYLGSHGLLKELGGGAPRLGEAIAVLEKQGKTVVALCSQAGAAALFAVADTVRQSSVEAIRELENLNVRAIMLTGDNEHTASAIAEQVGVAAFKANLLPQEKLAAIAELEGGGNVVGMVGDGINDAPALARANIGFAMARGGTDTAIETADVALMDDDLRKIPRFIRLSRATHAILLENIALALGIKAVFFALTLTGNATMWMAVFADVGAALLVVFNGLRASRK